VPICLYAWLRSPRDFRRAVGDVVRLGGDADTTGAIVGRSPERRWARPGFHASGSRSRDFPRSLAWIRRLGRHLDERAPPPGLWWPAIPLRNAAFTAIVIATALRRLLPPY